MLVLAIVWALFVPVADWLAHHDVGLVKGSLHETALDNYARGRLLTLGAGLFAAGALVFTAQNFILSRHTLELSQRTFELTEQGQVTDRYTKAVEQLGSDKLDVRIGGIYALERVSRDSAKDQPTVMEVLTAFIREHSREQWPPSDAGQPVQERSTRPDVQAAVTVVGRRDQERGIVLIDLTDADLTRADLTDARLARARLARARLTDAYLGGADLTHAYLLSADLAHAYLTDARLPDARLIGARLPTADLTSADLRGADLRGADLISADLTGADLTGAILRGAHLIYANFTGATLTGAHFTDADLTGTTLTGATLTGARWSTAVPVPEGWMIDDESGLLKPAGRLSEVMTRYL